MPEERDHPRRERGGVDRRPALEMARPTDLVLIFCDAITRSWKQIIYFQPEGGPGAAVRRSALVAAAGFDVPEGYRVLSDERGVRLVPAELTGAWSSAAGARRSAAASSPSSAAGSRRATSRSSPRCTASPAAASWSSRPPPAEPEAVGEESAQAVPLLRLRDRGRAADRGERRDAWRTTRAWSPGSAPSAASISPAATRRRSSPRWRRAGWRRRCSRAIRAAQAAGGLVAGSSAGAAMMSQPMILGGTSIESVRARRDRRPRAAGAADGRGPRLLSRSAWSTSTSSSAAGSAASSSPWPRPGCAAASASTRTPRCSSRAAPAGSAASTG